MDNFQDTDLSVPELPEPYRLDQFLADNLPLSRRRIRRAIDEGGVYLNKKRCRKAGQLLQGGEQLRIVLLENETLVPFSGEQLIWQEPPFYLIHKRSGQYAQEALHRSQGTIPEELAAFLQLPPQQARQLRPVHRLDRDTSGLMLLCTDAKALQRMQELWHTHVRKEYLAVVSPAPEWEEMRITLPIGKKRDRLGRYHVDTNGRPCDSEAKVLERDGERALVRLVPHTGRTHQLRIHLAHLGCPILGDTRYGGRKHERLMLHACALYVRVPALKNEHNWHIEPEENWKWH